MTTIITVRHAVTAHNAARVISGRIDEPLSDEGRAHARELAAMGILPVADRVVASPMTRAVETAILLTGRAAEQIDLDARCLERDYGELQGLDATQARAYADRVHYIEVGGIAHSLDPPGGESFESVRARARSLASDLRARSGETVIVVTHQVFLQQFHGVLLAVDVHPALAFDIRSLQVDEFSPSGHRVLHPGSGRHRSW